MNGVSESERIRFNNNFEMLQGEQLKSEDIVNTIDAIKGNISNLNVVSNKELKIEVTSIGGDEKLGTTLQEFIKKDKNKNYNVKLEYDNETGLVKYVVLTIVEKSR